VSDVGTGSLACMVVVAGDDDNEAVEAARRAAEALQPSQEAIRRAIESAQVDQDAIRKVVESIQPDRDALRRIAESIQPHHDALQRIAESIQPNHDALRRMVESIQPNLDAIRRLAESIQPSLNAIRRSVESMRIDPAMIAAVNHELANGLDWQAPALAMPGPQVATFTRMAAESAPGEAADALAEFNSVLSDEDGEQNRTLYDWLSDLTPLAQDRVTLVAIKSLAALVLAGYAEAGAHPPFHIGVVIVLLVAIANVWDAKNGTG
jgi:phage-related tail protein